MSSNVFSPLRMSQSESRINKHSLLLFIKGNVYCAWYSHLHQAIDKQRLSGAQSLLPRLDETGHQLSHFGYADRPWKTGHLNSWQKTLSYVSNSSSSADK